MTLSTIEEQEVREFAQANATLISAVISPSSETIHREENFFGEAFSIAMFLSFAKSLAAVLGGAVTIAKVISSGTELFKWVRSSKKEPCGEPQPSLSERVLILIFDAYVNRKAGLRPAALSALLGERDEQIENTLKALEVRGVVRHARDGSWKYVRPV